MPEKKLILHVGTPKTGTTSIQEFLRVNAKVLSRQGITVPTHLGSNHVLLPVLALPPTRWPEFDHLRGNEHEIQGWLRRVPKNRLIFSSEYVWGGMLHIRGCREHTTTHIRLGRFLQSGDLLAASDQLSN